VAALERLPGIGPYTARAVASLAFGAPVGVVDTNVRRWLVRRFGLRPDGPAAELQLLADALARAGSAADAAPWTHATMEFGAAVCTTREPRCGSCPIADGCPSRDRTVAVPVPRQAAFAGSDRAYRGALLRALTAAPNHAMTTRSAGAIVGAADLHRLVTSLERDGLVHRSKGRLVLGGPPEPAATIGP
jgi:A/G-specific adenine glycosylase